MATPMADNTLYPVPPVAVDAPPTVEVEPKAAYEVTNQTTKFTAKVFDGGHDEITDAVGGLVWSVNGVRGGDPAFGQISDDGTYLAPYHTPNPSAYEIGCRYETAVGRAVVSIVPTEADIPQDAAAAPPTDAGATVSAPTTPAATTGSTPASSTTTTGGTA